MVPTNDPAGEFGWRVVVRKIVGDAVAVLFVAQLCLAPQAAANSIEAVEGGPGPQAGALCRLFGLAALPALAPLTLGSFEPGKWAGDRRQCYTMLTHGSMAVGALVVNHIGHPRRPAVFGGGEFDRFFRDALRSRSKRDNFFASGPGALWAPIFASGALLLTAPAVAGRDGYVDSLSRALPLLWLGIAGNALPTATVKKGFGRRPFLAFENQRRLRAFGPDDDARQSFYSGHVSTAFFSAAFMDPVVADVICSRWPGYSFFCGAPLGMRLARLGQGAALYGLAAAVAHSRIEIDKHFMSDVLVGGLVGFLHGRVTYRLGYRGFEERPGATVTLVPAGRGIRVSLVF